MKKSIICLLFMLLVFCVLLFSCSDIQSASSVSEVSENSTAIYNRGNNLEKEPAEQHEITARVNNDTPCEQLVKASYPAEQVLNPWTPFKNAPSILIIDDALPIECLRDAGNGFLYAIYQTTEGGRLFYFFDQSKDYSFSYSAYVYKPVSQDIYMQLKIDDPLNKVLEVDAAFASALSKQHIVNAFKLNDVEYSFALLKDALVVLQYRQNGEGAQDVVISEIQVLNDKKLVVGENVVKLQERERPPIREVFDFTILPQDYPD